MKPRISQYLGSLIGLLLCGAALWALHHGLADYQYQNVSAYLSSRPSWQLLAALCATALSYLITTGYDWLALRYIRRPLPWFKVGFAALLSYAFSNSVGLAMLASGSLRYRLYSSWGMSAVEIAKIVLFTTLTLWLGILSVAGSVLLLNPFQLHHIRWLTVDSRYLGAGMLLLPSIYLLLGIVRRQPLRWRTWEWPLVRWRLASAQLLVGASDWVMAGLVLYILLPIPTPAPFWVVIGAFLIAQTLGLLSHIPGGLGVFESLIVLLLGDYIATADLIGALLAYRIVYYLLPLALAALSLGIYELRHQAQRILWLPRSMGPWVPVLLPQLFALLALVSGAVLLFSAATPGIAERLHWLQHFIPLSVLEISHFISGLLGAGLLLLARGLQRRLDAAWLLTVILLSAGIAASLLKGVDYEEAIFLSILLAGLLPSRAQFYRQASLFGERFTPSWLLAIAVILLCALWLGLFSYKDVAYSNALWWEFHVGAAGEAPRFLRAMAAAVAVALLFAVRKLLQPATFIPNRPSAADLQQAQRIAATFHHAYAWLALCGDKALLFNAQRSAFLMYAVEGRTWVAMGDPVATDDSERRELAWQFRTRCERQGAWPVFYQVRPEHLGLYVELGLSLLKCGEEARVALRTFSLQGKAHKARRNTISRVERAGLRFAVLTAAAVPSVFPQLRQVSAAWLHGKRVREKGFSLGFYNEDYLKMGMVAVVWEGENIVAFANLWDGGGEELSVDLMRYLPSSTHSLMDYLFLKTMLWGQERGYAWFNLGMAPLAGLQNRSFAPLWNRFGALVFGRGEKFYNFRGLHQYKDKFDPCWEPRYIAAPNGLTVLPRIMTDVTTLIAGGLRGVIGK